MSITQRKDIKRLYVHYGIECNDATIEKIKRVLNEQRKC